MRFPLTALALALALALGVDAQAHLLPSQHGTFRFDGDKLYMVLALSPDVLGAACDRRDIALTTQFEACHAKLRAFIADHLEVFSESESAQLLDLRIAPTTAHDEPTVIDQITALGVFRVPQNSALFVELDLFSESGTARPERFDLIVSSTTQECRHYLHVPRSSPVAQLRAAAGSEAGAVC